MLELHADDCRPWTIAPYILAGPHYSTSNLKGKVFLLNKSGQIYCSKHFSEINQLYYLKGRFAKPINTNRKARKNR